MLKTKFSAVFLSAEYYTLLIVEIACDSILTKGLKRKYCTGYRNLFVQKLVGTICADI